MVLFYLSHFFCSFLFFSHVLAILATLHYATSWYTPKTFRQVENSHSRCHVRRARQPSTATAVGKWKQRQQASAPNGVELVSWALCRCSLSRAKCGFAKRSTKGTKRPRSQLWPHHPGITFGIEAFQDELLYQKDPKGSKRGVSLLQFGPTCSAATQLTLWFVSDGSTLEVVASVLAPKISGRGLGDSL